LKHSLKGKGTAMSKRIGFVGLGQMGQPMALNLLKAGFAIRLFDLREERLAPLVARGATQAMRLG
jgi:3-hydroxyisobutyrate dehydrogenase-like beta-hydroxyacid dehydrogenase